MTISVQLLNFLFKLARNHNLFRRFNSNHRLPSSVKNAEFLVPWSTAKNRVRSRALLICLGLQEEQHFSCSHRPVSNPKLQSVYTRIAYICCASSAAWPALYWEHCLREDNRQKVHCIFLNCQFWSWTSCAVLILTQVLYWWQALCSFIFHYRMKEEAHGFIPMLAMYYEDRRELQKQLGHVSSIRSASIVLPAE